MQQSEIDGVSIVVRGIFNPAIFQPAWLAHYNLIRQEEAEAIENVILNSGIAQFSAAEWLNVTVVQDRFQTSTTQQPYFEALRDLVVGVFRLIRHTPITLMGINREYHYKLESEEVWHSLGHRLVPKKDWDDLLEQPGTRRLDVEGLRPDDYHGHIKVRVEPSPRFEFGLYVEVNDHYVFQANNNDTAFEQLHEILTQNWQASINRADEIAQKLSNLSR